MRLTYLLGLPLLAGACADAADQSGDSFQDDDIPMGGCGTSGTECPETGGSAGAAAIGEPCDATNHCATGVCAAPFDAGEIGELVCHSACIDYADEAMWCGDVAACCDPNATCSRGLCVMAQGADESTGESSGSSDGPGDSSDSSSSTDSSSETTGTTGGGR